MRALLCAGVRQKKTEEGRRVQGAEAATEGRGGGDRAAPQPAGEGGADKGGEGGEAEENLEQEILCQVVDGGVAWINSALRRR